MSKEVQQHLEAAERATDMKDMRMHLVCLDRLQYSFGNDEWRRYQAISEKLQTKIMQLFGASMGS